MKDKLPGVGSLNINKGSAWPGIIGIVIGGLAGLLVLIVFHSTLLYTLNSLLFSGFLGGLYARIYRKDTKVIIVGAIIGGICGLHPISFGIFALTTPYILLLLSQKSNVSPLFTVGVGLLICLTGARLGHQLGEWGKHLFWYNKPAFIWLCRPYFAIPLFSFCGYFIGCKISEGKNPKEHIRETPEGGLSMAEDPAFLKETNEGISPVAFSEKAMIQDLLSALNNSNLLSVKLQSWKARAKGQDQLKAFEMIREMLEKETDIIEAYTANQQARLDFENLKEFNQYLQKERLKGQLTEEKYKQAELEEKLKRMKLEEEYKRLELQRKIEGLKKVREETESRIERIKKEQLEKIDFQEEVRKVKTLKLADRIEYLHKLKKEWRQKYPSEEAEEIIDQLDRMLVEEGIKEE